MPSIQFCWTKVLVTCLHKQGNFVCTLHNLYKNWQYLRIESAFDYSLNYIWSEASNSLISNNKLNVSHVWKEGQSDVVELIVITCDQTISIFNAQHDNGMTHFE